MSREIGSRSAIWFMVLVMILEALIFSFAPFEVLDIINVVVITSDMTNGHKSLPFTKTLVAIDATRLFFVTSI